MRSRSDARAAWSTVKSLLALARALERGRNWLDDRGEFARRERDEGHAGAIGVARATWTIAITVEGRSVGALEAVILADDPFLHAAMSSLGVPGTEPKNQDPPTLSPHCDCVSFSVRILSVEIGLEKGAK
jgi:hypothetical protein